MVSAIPLLVSAATFERDLFFGMRNNEEVKHLQEFLRDKGFYTEPITGNFFSLTKQALMNFQKKEEIIPAQGYFGIKTREKVNTFFRITPPSREELIASLQLQIQILQARVADLVAQAALEKRALTITAVPAILPSPSPSLPPPPSALPSISPIPTSVASSTSPAPIIELRISGKTTQVFPDTATSPLKLGDIMIKNTTDHPVSFNQLQLDIYDAMNSFLNRGKKVIFKLRNGTTTFDTLISATDFTVNSQPPPYGQESNRRQLDVSFPITIKTNETYVSSLWIENLDYVISGSLRVEMLTAYISNSITPQGGFAFLLTKP